MSASPGFTDALARPRRSEPPRSDEREFAPALRAIARAKKLAPQLQLLGRVHTLLGAAALSAALAASIALSGAALVAAPLPRLVLGLGGALIAVLAALGAPWLALGFGLRRRRPWARGLGVVCAALLLPFLPVGTLLGAWTLVVLLAWNPTLARAAGTD